jgi:hypothetical protein
VSFVKVIHNDATGPRPHNPPANDTCRVDEYAGFLVSLLDGWTSVIASVSGDVALVPTGVGALVPTGEESLVPARGGKVARRTCSAVV